MFKKISINKLVVSCVILIILVCLCGSCKSTGFMDTRIESLVESRLIAERDRIRGEYAAELAGWIAEDIRKIRERLDRITDGQAVLRAAVEEYRRFCRELIEKLQQGKSGK